MRTSPPVGFLLSYLAICFLRSLLAAYFPTAPAIVAVDCWGEEGDCGFRCCSGLERPADGSGVDYKTC